MFEIWKPLPTNEMYEVSNFGRVKKVNKLENGKREEKILKPYFEDYYLKVTLLEKPSDSELDERLTCSYKLSSHFVHELVAETFLERTEENKTIVFKNNKHHMPWASNLKLV